MLKQSFNEGWTYREVKHAHIIPDVERIPVTLPHDPVIRKPRDPNSPSKAHSGFRNGTELIYDKDFFVAEEDRSKVFILEFEGICEHSLVYVNDEYAGKCHNSYTNFRIDLCQHLKYGALNSVRIVVCAGAMPSSRWYIGTGIYRNVNLYTGALTYITPDGVRITTEELDDEIAVVRIDTTVANCDRLPQRVWVTTEILDADGSIVATDSAPVTPLGNDTVTLRQRTCIRNPRPWSDVDPQLYTIRTILKGDRGVLEDIHFQSGLRILNLDPLRGLRVNGRPVKLRGACIHHNSGFLGVATYARSEEYRVMLLKNAGFNAIRSAHNPMSKAMLDACDRLGMYVMDESFDQWNKPKTAYDYSLHFAENWEKDIRAMVEKDYNHPCVLLYSIGNEILELFERDSTHLCRCIADKVRALDPTRYVTNCVNGWLCVCDEEVELVQEQMLAEGKRPVDINEAMNNLTRSQLRNLLSRCTRMTEYLDEPAAALDILGLNYMADRYALDSKIRPNRIMVGSETFPQDIAYNWRIIKRSPNVLGDFTWTGLEYLGEVGIARHQYKHHDPDFYGPYPHAFSGSGDIDFTGTRLSISYYREIVFGLRKDPYIAVQRPAHFGEEHFISTWGWSDSISSWTWPGFESKPIIVEIYSDAEEVELFLNDASLGVQPCGDANDFIAHFTLHYQPGRLTAIARNVGIEVGRFELKTAAKPAILAVDADRNVLKAGCNDLCYITFSIRDESGTLNPSDDREITLDVCGAGVLQGFGNADPLASGDYYLNHMRTYCGVAQAIVRAEAAAGEIQIRIQADGLPEQCLILQVKD